MFEWLFIFLFSSTWSKLGDWSENSKKRNEAKKMKKDWYFDSNGIIKNTWTNETLYLEQNENGENCLYNFDGVCHVNLSRKTFFYIPTEEDMKNEYKTVYLFDTGVGNKANWKEPLGKRYKDFKTGEVYVARRLEYDSTKNPDSKVPKGLYELDVYINFDGLIIREIDARIPELKRDDQKRLIYDEGIAWLNEKMEKSKNRWGEWGKSTWAWRNNVLEIYDTWEH